ncbi:MAG: EamA family transporter, partial [Kiloniellales bacterium]|nr:EamA family transporter [Kiloniellales bacterium]
MLAAGVFTSTAGILLRWVEQADGWQVLFYRSLSFTLALLAFVALRHRGGLVQVFREIGRPGLIAAVSLAVAFSSFVFALLATSVANVVFILSLSP